mmetsp:Transcript_11145/g.46799  ORF Transcript_11145/g.46799 Transcript_11145/m.46799 type:complete len:421 (+) Transcript_11145:761-2023(+)
MRAERRARAPALGGASLKLALELGKALGKPLPPRLGPAARAQDARQPSRARRCLPSPGRDSDVRAVGVGSFSRRKASLRRRPRGDDAVAVEPRRKKNALGRLSRRGLRVYAAGHGVDAQFRVRRVRDAHGPVSFRRERIERRGVVFAGGLAARTLRGLRRVVGFFGLGFFVVKLLFGDVSAVIRLAALARDRHRGVRSVEAEDRAPALVQRERAPLGRAEDAVQIRQSAGDVHQTHKRLLLDGVGVGGDSVVALGFRAGRVFVVFVGAAARVRRVALDDGEGATALAHQRRGDVRVSARARQTRCRRVLRKRRERKAESSRRDVWKRVRRRPPLRGRRRQLDRRARLVPVRERQRDARGERRERFRFFVRAAEDLRSVSVSEGVPRETRVAVATVGKKTKTTLTRPSRRDGAQPVETRGD